MASGWNLWVWLECIGVVIIIITFPTPLVLALFLPAASLFLCSFFKYFFVLVYVIFVKYIANVAQRTFKIVQKSRSANHPHIYNNAINCCAAGESNLYPGGLRKLLASLTPSGGYCFCVLFFYFFKFVMY